MGTADPAGFTQTYTVTGGTKQFSHVTGFIDVTATVDWGVAGPVFGNPGAVIGTFTPHLHY
jgi:hypothetical protein